MLRLSCTRGLNEWGFGNSGSIYIAEYKKYKKNFAPYYKSLNNFCKKQMRVVNLFGTQNYLF